MARLSKTRVLIETRMPDGGWIQLPGTSKREFQTIPQAEDYVNRRIRPGEIWRIARVTGVYYIKQELVKR